MDAKLSSETSAHKASPARLQEFSRLGQFTVSVIKAMLQTGYYAANHPEARKALAGLYAEFRQVIGDRSELTYLVGLSGNDRMILIDGYDVAPLSLDEVMLKGMADLFQPKFLEFFDRRNLLSFSFKADIAAEEFHPFVELMSQPPTASRGTEEERQRLTQAFLDQHILHISTVFNEDLVGKERRLPWRVEMALSRLRRDLNMLPLYKRATPEQLRQIKIQVIDDVIRPMRTPALVKDFLVNCDLVAADIAVLKETEIEGQIVGRLSVPMLLPTARELIKDLERLGAAHQGAPGDGPSTEMTRRLEILQEIIPRLREGGSGLEDDLLEPLLQWKLLSLEDLPPDLRHLVETRRLADAFLTHKDEHVEALGRIGSDEAGRQLATLIARILPELLRRREYGTLTQILQTADQGRRGPSPSPVLGELAGRLQQAMATQDTIRHLVEDLVTQDKDGRTHLAAILAFIGDAAGPGLVEGYARTDNKAARASAFEAMTRIGTNALHPFLTRLADIEREWFVLRHILATVGDHGDRSLALPVSQCLRHGSVPVRQAALTALFKLQGPAAEGACLRALRDVDPAVRQMAVEYLGRLQSRHPQALEFYTRALQVDETSASQEADAVLVQVCQALAGFSTLSSADVTRAEAILLAALAPAGEKGFLRRFTKTSRRHSESVQVAVCEALAEVGTPAAVPHLRRISEADESPVAKKAAAATRQIQERSSRKAASPGPSRAG